MFSASGPRLWLEHAARAFATTLKAVPDSRIHVEFIQLSSDVAPSRFLQEKQREGIAGITANELL
jgi:hypothetical protein